MSPPLRLMPYGDAAVLVEPADAALVPAVAGVARDLPGVREVVPAARTVLVVFDEPPSSEALRAALGARLPDTPPPTVPELEPVVLDVRYDGADLADTAAELGLDTDALVRAHCDAPYVVAFCGFAPGFAYLSGLPAALHVPRRAEPRTRVPAGSVAIAGEFSGVYPAASPGGWRLLGTTTARLWDLDRDPPALLTPGTAVRFRTG